MFYFLFFGVISTLLGAIDPSNQFWREMVSERYAPIPPWKVQVGHTGHLSSGTHALLWTSYLLGEGCALKGIRQLFNICWGTHLLSTATMVAYRDWQKPCHQQRPKPRNGCFFSSSLFDGKHIEGKKWEGLLIMSSMRWWHPPKTR